MVIDTSMFVAGRGVLPTTCVLEKLHVSLSDLGTTLLYCSVTSLPLEVRRESGNQRMRWGWGRDTGHRGASPGSPLLGAEGHGSLRQPLFVATLQGVPHTGYEHCSGRCGFVKDGCPFI